MPLKHLPAGAANAPDQKPAIFSQAIALVQRGVTALANSRHKHWVLVCILAAYAVVWTIYTIVAKSTQDIHPDTGEFVAWSSDLEWGTPKHPPFLPAVVRLWLLVFPLADWAFYLLAILNLVVGIYFIWLLSGLWLQGAKRAAIPFLLMLIPFFNVLGLNFNHNTILIPLWAITTYSFVRSYRERSIRWSVVTGVLAGVCVLAKYWSVLLLLGLSAAALADTDRLGYLKSWSPWIITTIFFSIILPHVIWLSANGFPTIIYSHERSAYSTEHLFQGILGYLPLSTAYLSAPLLLFGFLIRPTKTAMLDIFFPREKERRFAAIAFWVPIFAALPLAGVLWVHLSALWVMPALALLGVVILSSPLIKMSMRSVTAIAAIAVTACLAALTASPVIALGKLYWGAQRDAAYTQLLAHEVQKMWQKETVEPLQFVAGSYELANPIAFYLDKNTLPISFFALSRASWDNQEAIAKFGAAVVCVDADARCRSRTNEFGAETRFASEKHVVVRRQWLGLAGPPKQFLISIMLPTDWVAEELSCCVSSARRFKRPEHSETPGPK
jgi:hypothetical protein